MPKETTPEEEEETELAEVRDAPAFDFYPERWLMGTAHMSDGEQITYLRLLCHQWMMQGLPDDAGTLKRLGGRVLEKFPVQKDGRRRNKRLEILRNEQRERIAKCSEQRRQAALKRWGLKPAGKTPPSKKTVTESPLDLSACGRIAGADASALRPECPPLTTHLPPHESEREREGLDASLVEEIVAAYPRQDAPFDCYQAVQMSLDGGEDPQQMLAAVKLCADHIRVSPGGSANRFVPKARSFFQREEWRSPESFVKTHWGPGKGASSPTAYQPEKPPSNGWGDGTDAPWAVEVEDGGPAEGVAGSVG
jgi:hypothetical protein